MEPLARRAYNRQLRRRAAAGVSGKVHIAAATVSVLVAVLLHVAGGLVTFVLVELAFFFFRRFVAAPHELYAEQVQQHARCEAEIAALRKQVQQLPTPRLVLTYAVESLKGYEDEVSNPPILLHNDGNAAAIDASVDELRLSPLITVKFSTVQRIAPHDTTAIAVRVEIRTAGGGWELDHNQAHFGLAIQRAHFECANRDIRTERGLRRWPLTLRYHDASGAPSCQSYELLLDVAKMKAWTALVKAGQADGA